MEYPRLLIMSHNSFSDIRNNGKTMTALFENWPKECLAQFYIQNETPSYSICTNYFHITDLDILHANFKFNTAKGRVLTEDENSEADHVYINLGDLSGWKRITYKMLYNRVPISELARDIAWRKSKWKSLNLINWLDEYKPQAVFTLSSHQPFFHKMTEWVCRKYTIPLFLYSTDDYTFPTSVFSPVSWLNYLRYMHWFKRSLRIAKKFYAISPGMKEEYENKFDLQNVGMLLNCVPVQKEAAKEDTSKIPLRIIYAGGIHLNRWKVLSCLADCLLELRKMGCDAVLDIYCPVTPTEEIIKKLNKFPVASYKGSLNQHELLEKVEKSNVLVHVESFDKKSMKSTRLSISTKIPEYMASNRMIFAIGPEKVESMRYLQESGAALCINTIDKDKIIAMIKDKLFDADYRRQVAERSKILASENHDMLKTQSMLYKDLCDIVI